MWTDYTPLVSFIFLFLSTVGYSIVIPYIIEIRITKLVEEIDQLRFEQNSMRQDLIEYQRFFTKYTILYTSLQNLQAFHLEFPNNYNLIKITSLDSELLDAMRFAYAKLASNFDYETDEEHEKLKRNWNKMNYQQLVIENDVLTDRWEKDFNKKLDLIKITRGKIQQEKRKKEKLISILFVFQSIGILVGFIASNS